MKAVVKVINRNRGKYAAEIEGTNSYVIFELFDSFEPQLGDVISHPDFYSKGGESFTNITQNCQIDVFVEDVCNVHSIKKWCLSDETPSQQIYQTE